MTNSTPDFDSIKQINPYSMEYWSARDLAPLLGYNKWQNFEVAIRRAMTACEQVGQVVADQFSRITKKSFRAKGAIVEIVDYRLSKYAVHLVLTHADTKKPETARALAYFTLISLDSGKDYLAIAQQLKARIPLEIATTKEQKTIGEITRAFKHMRMERQYRVGPFRIDLYFPEHQIAIECDEEGHRRYTQEEERMRQVYIEHQLNCRFVRFN